MIDLNPIVATQILKKTVEGHRHPYYERVTGLADKYMMLMTGEDIEPLLQQFNPNEDEDMFAQRVRITKTIVGAVSGKVKGPFEKVARSNNVTKKFIFSGDDTETQLTELESILDEYWGDETLDDYMQQRMLDLAFSDPNSFLVTEMLTTKEGEEDVVHVFPFEVSSYEAVNYHYTNNTLDYLIVFDGARKYTMYTKEYTIVLIEKKDEEDKDQKDVIVPGDSIMSVTDASREEDETKMKIGSKIFEVRYVPNECNEIPAIRIGYKRDEKTHGNTFVSPMQKAVPRLEKIIKSDSELDLVVSLHAFPQKLQLLQRCQGQPAQNKICDHGRIRGTDNQKCPKCNGTGWAFHTSAQSALTYEMPTQDELNNGATIPDLDKLIAYKHPGIDIIKFENEYTRQLEDDVIKDVYLSQNFEKSSGPVTATEIEYDMDSVYDTLYPFARKFSAIYKKQVRIAACYVDLDEGLKVVHQFPKDFKLKTISQLLAERKAAEEANVPEFMKNQIDIDIAEKMLFDNPAALQKFRAKQQHLPFIGKSAAQIQDIITSGRSTRENSILWTEFENIMRELEDESFEGDNPMSFYDKPYKERVQLINAKVAEFMTVKSSELGVGSLDIEGLGESLSGDEIPKDIDIEAESKAKLRGTVGGVTGIININQAVASGQMTERAAEAMLVEIYGFDPEQAARLIEPIIQPPNTEE